MIYFDKKKEEQKNLQKLYDIQKLRSMVLEKLFVFIKYLFAIILLNN
jgi:hypothetical protein